MTRGLCSFGPNAWKPFTPEEVCTACRRERGFCWKESQEEMRSLVRRSDYPAMRAHGELQMRKGA